LQLKANLQGISIKFTHRARNQVEISVLQQTISAFADVCKMLYSSIRNDLNQLWARYNQRILLQQLKFEFLPKVVSELPGEK
jgi:hypothetical protein